MKSYSYTIANKHVYQLYCALKRISAEMSLLGYTLCWAEHADGYVTRFDISDPLLHLQAPALNGFAGYVDSAYGLPDYYVLLTDKLATEMIPNMCSICLYNLNAFTGAVSHNQSFVFTSGNQTLPKRTCLSCVRVGLGPQWAKLITYARLWSDVFEALRMASAVENYLPTAGPWAFLDVPFENFRIFIERQEHTSNNVLNRTKKLIGEGQPFFKTSQLQVVARAFEIYKTELAAALDSMTADLPPETWTPAKSLGLGKWYSDGEWRTLNVEPVGSKAFGNGTPRYLCFIREANTGYDFKVFRQIPLEVGKPIKLKARIKHRLFAGSWETHLVNLQIEQP